MRTDVEIWRDSQICGAAVNIIADRIMEGGHSRQDLARWLSWLTLVGAHPERHENLLAFDDAGQECWNALA